MYYYVYSCHFKICETFPTFFSSIQMEDYEFIDGWSVKRPMENEEPKRRPRRFRAFVLAVVLFMLIILPFKGPSWYTRLRFGIKTIYSPLDADGDLIDDYTDIMLAARSYIRTSPAYVSDYFSGGYPPEGQGVCTDVIWRALKAAGYDFKALIDADIAAHPEAYPLADGQPDPNIDFRRVVNLRVFFERHCIALTTQAEDIAQWQPGDFVIYNGHVAVVSDRRNAQGRPYIIHHTGHGAFEEDALTKYPILAHFRWAIDS